ncbi:hypothetical protein ACLB2K_007379 [Fragaria x ananassa]
MIQSFDFTCRRFVSGRGLLLVDSTGVKDHLFVNEIDLSYVIWGEHGEATLVSDNDSDHGMDTDSSESVQGNMELEIYSDVELDFGEDQEPPDECIEFQRLVEEANRPLYPGCKSHTKFNALLRLQNLKAKHHMSDAAYSDWVELIGDFFQKAMRYQILPVMKRSPY